MKFPFTFEKEGCFESLGSTEFSQAQEIRISGETNTV